MALLVGKHTNKIDRKGRVSVPKLFRDFLASSDGQVTGFYAYPSFKEPAIEGCSESFMNRVAESIHELPMFSDEQDRLNIMLLEDSHYITFDPEGRISVPQQLVAHAGITDQVMFVGHGKKFQIWSPERHAEHRKGSRIDPAAGPPTLKLRQAEERPA